MKNSIQCARFSGMAILLVLLVAAGSGNARAQATKWMSVGSMHSWYSEMGGEIEEGFVKEQQYGLRWPAIYEYQDMEAAKTIWLGTVNFSDAQGTHHFKVIHLGPRVDGKGDFFPVKFQMVSKYPETTVTVDGAQSFGPDYAPIDSLDPNMVPDRMIVTVDNTAIGLTMTRKIMEFSQAFHDSYIVIDYTFTNTGNTNADAAIERPNQVLDSVYVYLQWRLSVCADTRYVIGNATGWGINAMLDTRGDGVKNDADDAVSVPGIPYTSPHMRIQYVWHGKYPSFTTYDNVGGPIWTPYYDKSDTTGRLGAAQFVGAVTLHADHSATDPTDDFAQPVTTSWEGSDEYNTSNNDQFNDARMSLEWGWITKGHRTPRHADAVQPDGAFDVPTGDPALGTPGGFSNANGYGPYHLEPGQSIHIVLAEAAGGLSRERCISIGRRFKLGQINAKAKNDSVLTGKDSLFQTCRRAIANYESGYALPDPPPPPTDFTVTSLGDKISLTWGVTGSSPSGGFDIYRARDRYDGEYSLLYHAQPNDRSYDDTSASRGFNYYYYIASVGDPAPANNTLTPVGVPLASSRYYTQTYDYATLKRQPGASMSEIRIVPNPYIFNAAAGVLRYGGGSSGAPDRIAFYGIPGYCTIKIYTELGELIYTINHQDGSGDAYWNSITSSTQVVASGVYIAVIENTKTGERSIQKFVIIR